jgi:hypothetical protein
VSGWTCRRCGRGYRFKSASRRCEDGCAAVDSAHLGLVQLSAAVTMVVQAQVLRDVRAIDGDGWPVLLGARLGLADCDAVTDYGAIAAALGVPR